MSIDDQDGTGEEMEETSQAADEDQDSGIEEAKRIAEAF